MTDAQYWQWFWLNLKWGLIIGGPLFIASLTWAAIKYWDELHEDDEPKQHFITLGGK